MAMDVKRDPKVLRKKKIRQFSVLGVVVVALGFVTWKVMGLQPAAPSVAATTLWYDVVKRGPMIRNVRGSGTLAPKEIRWITPTTTGRVERIVLRAGAVVKPGDVIVELSNPDLLTAYEKAKLDLSTAESNLAQRKSDLKNARLQQEALLKNSESALKVAKTNLEANEKLGELGVISKQQILTLQAQVQQSQTTFELNTQQYESAIAQEATQLAPAQAAVAQQRSNLGVVAGQIEDLKVKSNVNGVLQIVQAQEGQTVGAGTNLARVADPKSLKAEVRVSETQTKDLAISQKAEITILNVVVKGHVSRIDPASVSGTVLVDIELDEAPPVGARADLSVDGTIELQRLDDILYVQRPSFGQENSKLTVFKVMPNGQPMGTGQEAGHEAVRQQVELGVSSVMFIEVKSGLNVGDKIVLSDMSAYDQVQRIRLN